MHTILQPSAATCLRWVRHLIYIETLHMSPRIKRLLTPGKHLAKLWATVEWHHLEPQWSMPGLFWAPPSSSCCSSRRVRALTVCGGWRVSCGRASRDRRSPCTSTRTTSDASLSVAATSRRATDDWAFPRTSDTLRQRPTAHTRAHTHACTTLTAFFR